MLVRRRKITGRGGAKTVRRLAVAFGALLPLAPAWAEDQALAPARAGNGTVVHLVERSERMVKRDRLVAELRVEADDPDPARLQAEINRRMAAALEVAKAVAGISLTTGSYGVYQQPVSPPTDRAQLRWHGAQSLQLRSTDAGALLALIGMLQQKGLVLSSLAYELTPEAARAMEDELTKEALARLRQRAGRIADDLGMSIDRLRNLDVGNADGTQPIARPFAVRAAGAAPAPVAEPGDVTVSLSVSADVLLAPRR